MYYSNINCLNYESSFFTNVTQNTKINPTAQGAKHRNKLPNSSSETTVSFFPIAHDIATTKTNAE